MEFKTLEESSKKYDAAYDAFDNAVREAVGPDIYNQLDNKTINLSYTGKGFLDFVGDWIKDQVKELK